MSQARKPEVSLLTVTRGSRVKFLEIQKLNVQEQTGLPSVQEWVLVDGSTSKDESTALVTYVDSVLRPYFADRFPVVLVPYKEGRKLGGHRNAGNDATKGDIIICMDDDDYYQPGYIKLAVTTLHGSNKLIAGCGPIYIYSLYWKMLFQADLITKNNSVNNAFCYKRAFLKNHRYREDCESGEEKDFTDSFSAPMEQMDPKKVVVQMSHSSNTVDKQKFLMSPLFNMTIGFNCTPTKIGQLVPADRLRMYEDLIDPAEDSPYDVVYYAGMMSIEWDPTNTALGGSEQAIVQLAKQWARQGLKVAVYGELKKREKTTVDGVDYYHFKDFHPQSRYKNLILWRLYGSAPVLRTGVVRAQRVFVDIHDNIPQHYEVIKKHHAQVDYFMFKSNFHVTQYTRITGHTLPREKIIVCMNGIQMDVFEKPFSLSRNPYRFCYCSSYDRGLIPILRHLWKLIVLMEPRAELHLYYGVDKKDPHQALLVQEFYNAFLNSTNVMDHGRQPIELVAREKRLSTFQLYLTNAPAEIDCISVRESLVAGCIPLLLNEGVFAERDGYHLTGAVTDPQSCMAMAIKILELANNSAVCEQLRQKLRKSPTVVDWPRVSERWNELFLKTRQGDEDSQQSTGPETANITPNE